VSENSHVTTRWRPTAHSGAQRQDRAVFRAPPEAVNVSFGNQVDQGLQRLGWILLAPHCVLCGARGAQKRDLCVACHAALPWNRCACPRCALPLSVAAPACPRCLKRPPPFVRSVAPLRYEGDAARLLPRYKFNADLAVGRVLADLLTESLRDQSHPDLVVPVPLHRSRLRSRGFDQAWELARRVAANLSLPARHDALRRTRPTIAQTGLNALTRRRNLRGAFAAVDAVRGLRIALVDDVVTTGATVAAAAGALRAAGASEVVLWAVARAP
jgi:ComF family protein